MNPLTNIRNVQKLNDRELELGIIGKKSWHDEYKDSAWIFIGGLPFDLSEGDVLCVFSQYGEIVNINLVRDHKTGKSKGFAFLCYEDQRSTVLSVDNLNGIKILGRTIRVDHVKDYKVPKEHGDEDELTKKVRAEGVAPKIESSSEDGEQDNAIELEEEKVEKKAKKKKRKKEKKSKRGEDSSSDNSRNEARHQNGQSGNDRVLLKGKNPKRSNSRSPTWSPGSRNLERGGAATQRPASESGSERNSQGTRGSSQHRGDRDSRLGRDGEDRSQRRGDRDSRLGRDGEDRSQRRGDRDSRLGRDGEDRSQRRGDRDSRLGRDGEDRSQRRGDRDSEDRDQTSDWRIKERMEGREDSKERDFRGRRKHIGDTSDRREGSRERRRDGNSEHERERRREGYFDRGRERSRERRRDVDRNSSRNDNDRHHEQDRRAGDRHR